jgi:hypothetical protein
MAVKRANAHAWPTRVVRWAEERARLAEPLEEALIGR